MYLYGTKKLPEKKCIHFINVVSRINKKQVNIESSVLANILYVFCN